VEQARLPEWETDLVEEVIAHAQARLEQEKRAANKRALQLARERAYHRLAVAIDRSPTHDVAPGQLTLFPRDPTLFDSDL
jgi:hypothetical protein